MSKRTVPPLGFDGR